MAKTVRKNFPVTGMGCAACVARVQGTIKNLNGVSECNVSLASNSAQVDYDPGTITAADIKKAVQDAGYDLIVVDEEDSEDSDEEAESEARRYQEDYLKSLRRDMILSLVLALVVMLLGHVASPDPVPRRDVAGHGIQRFPWERVCPVGIGHPGRVLVRQEIHFHRLEAIEAWNDQHGHPRGPFHPHLVHIQHREPFVPGDMDEQGA